ncbi:MAG: hypothetical protein DME04_22595 [Candidatus Rokuibacteriota bacterium]|nr:MAG: hypothetical protein DME04_22595 [Candidatus Rokubacteria bacterium]
MSTEPRALAPSEVARLLESAGAMIRAEFAALTEGALVWHPAPGEWCAKEVLGHLIETERRGFTGRIRIILAGDDPALEGWDQAEVARARRDCERVAATLVEEFTAMRRDSAALVASLRTDDLRRAGRHPKVGPLRVADLLHEWVHHDRNHLRQMLANLQAFAWPHMGNAQRFSTP